MTFTDKEQFKLGMDIEQLLDDLFTAKGWTIERVTQHEERVLCLGDRRFKKGNVIYTVEYKSGIQTFFTGNVFLETVSVDTSNKPGWLYTSKAKFILYAAILNGKILVFRPETLREKADSLKSQFKTVKTSKGQNDGYNTHGLIVPLAYAEKHLALMTIPFRPEQYAEYALRRILTFTNEARTKRETVVKNLGEIERVAKTALGYIGDVQKTTQTRPKAA